MLLSFFLIFLRNWPVIVIVVIANLFDAVGVAARSEPCCVEIDKLVWFEFETKL